MNDMMIPMDYQVYVPEKRERIRYFLISCALAVTTGYLFYGSLIAGILIALLSIPGERIYREYRRKRVLEELRYSFKDLLYSLSSSIGAGRQIPEGLVEAEHNLSRMYQGEKPIMREIRYMNYQIKSVNRDENLLLRDLGRRSGLREIQEFAGVYETCRATGANLSAVVAKTVEMLTDRFNAAREKEKEIRGKMNEARIITFMPFLIIVFLKITSPGYLDPVYEMFLGRIIMSLALGIIVFSYYVILRICSSGLE